MPGKRDTAELIDTSVDPAGSAEAAGLHYVSGEGPCIRRRRHGRGFVYLDADGQRVDDPEVRARIDALVIPPAWTDVWICPSAQGHIQATGRDDQGRKQYLYHSEWERVRNETKFNRMIVFAEALPGIRGRCGEDLARRNLSREKVLATVVTLLDRTLIRIGNSEYARRNSSFGLTTLRDRHVDVDGTSVTFTFTGKSGKKHQIEFADRRLARIVRRCRDIPGYELFQYYDEDGNRATVDSASVNEYIRAIAGADFTAKDFRTWGGSVHAALVLEELGPASSATNAKRKLSQMARAVGERLGNTPAVCRAYYIHPAIIDAFEAGTFHDAWERHLSRAKGNGLEPEESALLALLREWTLSD